MNKLVIILIVIAIAIGFYKLLSTNPSVSGVKESEAQLILFWGDGCPHCETVKEYIKNNNLESKIKIAYKEVYYNKSNQKNLEETVKNCPEIDTSQGVGVPLALDTQTKRCLSGDTPIIDWLKSK